MIRGFTEGKDSKKRVVVEEREYTTKRVVVEEREYRKEDRGDDIAELLGLSPEESRRIKGVRLNLLEYIDPVWFEEFKHDEREAQAFKMEDEPSKNKKFPNQLIQIMVETGILQKEEFEKDSDGNPDYNKLDEDVNLPEKIESWIGLEAPEGQAAIQDYIDVHGREDFERAVKKNGLLRREELIDHINSILENKGEDPITGGKYRKEDRGDEKIETNFIDAEGTYVHLEAELRQRRNYPMKFTMSGDISGSSSGQMLDSIVPADDVQEKIVEFWREHHLKAITEEQWDEIKDLFSAAQHEGGVVDYDDLTLFGDDPHVAALAAYLDLSPEEAKNIKDVGDSYYRTGKSEYIVATDDEAQELAHDSEVDLLEGIGTEGLNLDISQFIDTKWFEDAERESFESYVDDIENEGDRLKKELKDQSLIEEDEDLDEDGEIKDIDEKKRQYVEKHLKDIDDFVQYYIDNFGREKFDAVVKRYDLIDYDALADEIISIDGRGSVLNHYDGIEDEVEIDGVTYYIYRQ